MPGPTNPDSPIETQEHLIEEKDLAELLADALKSIAIGMTAERTPLRWLELILIEAMRLADCEGVTVYRRTDDDCLEFLIVKNDILSLDMGGPNGAKIMFEALPLHDDKTGMPNRRFVATHVALTGLLVNVVDAYATDRFDFSGTKQIDALTGYRSKSFLTLPLKNKKQEVIGVLQLINARDPKTGEIVAFSSEIQNAVEILAELAAAALAQH